MTKRTRNDQKRPKPGSKRSRGLLPPRQSKAPRPGPVRRRNWRAIGWRLGALAGGLVGLAATYISIRPQIYILAEGRLPDSPDEPSFVIGNNGLTVAYDLTFDCAIQGSYRAERSDMRNISLASAEASYPSGNMAPTERLAPQAQTSKYCSKRFRVGSRFDSYSERSIIYVVRYSDFFGIRRATVAKFGNSIGRDGETMWAPVELSASEREDILAAHMPAGRAEVCERDCELVPIMMMDENGSVGTVEPQRGE